MRGHSAIPDWVRDYIGITFKHRGRCVEDGGFDCWGIIRLVYRERFGVELPSYLDHMYGASNLFGVKKTVDQVVSEGPFVRHSTAARIGDCVLLHIRGLPLHAALFVGRDAGRSWVLHTTSSRGTSYREALCSRELEHAEPVFYRYRGFCENV